MYVDSSTVKVKGKKYTRHLLRESYREAGKVKHRTIANISKCSPEEIEAIRLALRHKKHLADVLQVKKSHRERQGPSVGAVWTVYDIARGLGIDKALGNSKQGKLALWQVIARVIDQGSRLSAVRLASSHAACDILGIDEPFDEEDLYANLDWLCEKQSVIEQRLFKKMGSAGKAGVFLYDVTSSYFEGMENELAAFGCNRDGKRGKRQIVVELLCNGDREPLSIEVFAGNTQYPQTFGSQIRKVVERFGGESITFVGDRGMIKSDQVRALGETDFHYITAITKAQINKLLKQDVIQLGLFDHDLAEVTTDSGIRYILRRNPMRAMQLKETRRDKLETLKSKVAERNTYLSEHPRAKAEVALRKVKNFAERVKIAGWVSLTGEASERRITVTVDEAQLVKESKLDGCYVLKTDLVEEVASKELVHDRYRDLEMVERAFRTSKTVQLELRPIHVRLESRTRGHAFVVILAYRIVWRLSELWRDLDLTVQEGINELSTLCSNLMEVKGEVLCQRIPQPRASVQQLPERARVKLPDALPHKGVVVTTKTKLLARRLKP